MRALILLGHDTVTQVLATHTGGPYTNQIQSIPISEYTNMCNSKIILLHPSYNSEFMVLLLFSYLNLVVGKYKVKKKKRIFTRIVLLWKIRKKIK